ncbi:MAG: cation:proton antiporter, partial [Elusimicrobia bacterium]|nr:cation:proton antiporter [Elusimicrobiota bacterium]
SAAMGAASFFVSFVLIFIFSFYVLKWSYQASIITASSLSSTSIAIIYSIMTEKGLNKTSLGKGILGACFVNGFLTLSSLSLFFQKTDYKTLVFLFFSLFTLFIFPYLTSHLTNVYGNRTAAIRSKWVSFFLFSYGALALWAKTEPVLAAYIAGVALGEFAGNNSQWIRRMRTLTVGFFTSFYFLRVGIMCSIDVFYSSLGIIILFFIVRFIGKYAGLYPVSGLFMKVKKERFFYSMLLTTGLTFDTIAAVFGYSHSIIDKTQYSVLIAVIILAAIIPGFIANKYAPARAAHEQLKEEYQE